MKNSMVWPIIVMVSAAAATAAVAAPAASPVRVIVVAWFMLVCPGLAYVGLLRLNRPLAEVMLSIALSLAIDAIVAEVMALSNTWSPAAGLTVLVALSMTGAVLQLIVLWRAPVKEVTNP